MNRIHRRPRALAFLFVLSPLCWIQPAQANPMSVVASQGGASAKPAQPASDSGQSGGGSALPDDQGCTLTLGYWKTHNAHADGPLNIPWPISEETLLCGETWLDILNTPPLGDAWLILAHQWIAAKLNEASGASIDSLNGALDEAEALLTGNCGGLKGDDEDRALELAGLLDDYNNGLIGPPHCGTEITDCNRNGIDDSIDISSGTSTDSNANGIPDECEALIRKFCIGTGVEDGGVGCPCGNTVPPGTPTGCANSTGTGASLQANGDPFISHDTVVLTATNIPVGKVAYFLFGSESSPKPFGDGTRCIGPFVRLQKIVSSTGNDTFPPPNSLPISQQLGINAGDTTVFQVIYRDGAGPCHNGSNATNAVLIIWGA